MPDQGRATVRLVRRGRVVLAVAVALAVPAFSGAQPNYGAALPAAPTAKILVKKDGWYRVTAASLQTAGFTFPSDIERLRLTTTYPSSPDPPVSVPFQVRGQGVEFYGRAQPRDETTDGNRVYWLTTSATGTASHMPILKARTTPASPSGSFAVTVSRPDRQTTLPTNYVGNVVNVPSNWFGDTVDIGVTTPTQPLPAPNVASSSGATLAVNIQGTTLSPHSVEVRFNGTLLGTLNGSNKDGYGATFTQPALGTILATNNVDLVAVGGSNDKNAIASLSLTYLHSFMADGNALAFPASGGVPVHVGGFSSANVRVLDITNPAQPRELAPTVRPDGGAYTASVTPPGTGAMQLYAFVNASPTVLTPSPSEVVLYQSSTDLRAAGNAANYVIIAHKNFINNSTLCCGPSSFVSFKQTAAGGNYTVKLVNVEDVFDQFAHGTDTPDALAAFYEYAYENWGAPKLHDVLLVGDATFDPRNYINHPTPFDHIPTSFHDATFSVVPSDDALADFDTGEGLPYGVAGDGIPRVAVGRIPVRTDANVTTVLNKILSYEQRTPQTRTAVLASDYLHPEDGYDFTAFNDDLRDKVLIPGGIASANIRRVDRPCCPSNDAAAHADMLNAVAEGRTIVNYFGHGNTLQMSTAPLLNTTDASSATIGNPTSLSLFIGMTCLNGYFAGSVSNFLSERLILNPNGGAVATWSSTGETVPGSVSPTPGQLGSGQIGASEKAIQGLLAGGTLGTSMLDAKAYVGDIDVRHSWSLLGDPTMVLR